MNYIKISLLENLPITQSLLFDCVLQGALKLSEADKNIEGYLCEVEENRSYISFSIPNTTYSFSMIMNKSTEIFQVYEEDQVEKNKLSIEMACATLAILFGDKVNITTNVQKRLEDAAVYVCNYIDSNSLPRSPKAPSWALSDREVINRLFEGFSEPTFQLC